MKLVLTLVIALSMLAMSNMAFAQYCVQGWQNVYQCDGSWQEQLYMNPDCSPYWSYIQYCSSGCSNGFCTGTTISPTACTVSASVTTPSSVQSNDIVSTTILLTNTGDNGGTVNVNAVLCMANNYNCYSIGCSSSQIYVPAHSIAYDVCSTRNYYYGYLNNPYGVNPSNYPYGVNPSNNPSNCPSNYPSNYPCNNYNYNYNYNNNNQGSFRIRADLNGCNLATSLYTPLFQIGSNQYCTPGNTNNYQCSGNARQVQYQYADCNVEWRNVETCAGGCSGGSCVTTTSTTTVSTVTTTITTQPKYVLPDLTTLVILLGIIVLLIIFFMLFTNEGVSKNYFHTYHDEAENIRFQKRFTERLGNLTSKLNFRKHSVC